MKKKILVLDDEELLTKTFAILLERKGYDVFVCAHGDDALVMIEEEDFDLIISDIRMPGRDGVDVVKSIYLYLSETSRNKPPVIFVTGYADLAVEEKAKDLKPFAYLSKPFDVIDLLTRVESALKGNASDA